MIFLLLTLLAGADSVPSVPADTARVVAVSPRVGNEIDAVERRRFHLFPGIESFSSAQFRQLPDSTIEALVVATGTRPAMTFPLTRDQFRQIGYFVDHYDELIPELARVPDGRSMYARLWTGIGPDLDSLSRIPPRGPDQSAAANQVLDAVTGAACGLAVGSTAGAVSGISFVENRAESLRYTDCSGNSFWSHYIVSIFDLDRGIYAAGAGIGTVAGGAAGYSIGEAVGSHRAADDLGDRGIAAHDFFGEPIMNVEIQRYLPIHNRIPATILGATSGWILGAGLGLVVTAIARSVVFRSAASDSIQIRHDGFAFDLPLISFSLAGALQGARMAYRAGKRMDWDEALEKVKRERLLPGSSRE